MLHIPVRGTVLFRREIMMASSTGIVAYWLFFAMALVIFQGLEFDKLIKFSVKK